MLDGRDDLLEGGAAGELGKLLRCVVPMRAGVVGPSMVFGL